MKLNLGAGKRAKPKSEGWVNVDKFAFPHMDPNEFEYRQMDLFRYPWEFADNCVDEVFASHIIEHIPHEPKPSCYAVNAYDPFHQPTYPQGWNAAIEQWKTIRGLDGFFCFFAEIWRVCKPDANIHIVCPYGYTRGAFQDPTHTRYIVPPTFSYLTSEENANWDYHLPLKFKILSVQMTVEPVYSQMPKEDLDWHLGHSLDVGYDLLAELQVVKE